MKFIFPSKILLLCALLLASAVAQQQQQQPQPDMAELQDIVVDHQASIADDTTVSSMQDHQHVRSRQLGLNHHHPHYTYKECKHYRDMCYNAECKWYNLACNVWLKDMCHRTQWCEKHYYFCD